MQTEKDVKFIKQRNRKTARKTLLLPLTRLERENIRKKKIRAKGSETEGSCRELQQGGGSLLLRQDALLGIKLFLGYKAMVSSYRIQQEIIPFC